MPTKNMLMRLTDTAKFKAKKGVIMKKIVIVLTFLASIAVAQKGQTPSKWYALQEDQTKLVSWIPADPNVEIDTEASEFPPGFKVWKEDGRVYTEFLPGPAGVTQATVVFMTEQTLGGSWAGPKVTTSQTEVAEIIRYKASVQPFFPMPQYEVLVSDPNQ